VAFYVIIPARYASSRLPGKPLVDIAGKPMVQRVYEQATQSQAKQVIVATDDERIESVVKAMGGDVVMTATSHNSGTDRLQEVVMNLGLDHEDIVVNVQGDEPLLPPELIDQVASNLALNTQADMATLSEPLESVDQLFDPNVVKVVFNRDGMAVYFSRAPIPWNREAFVFNTSALNTSVKDSDISQHYYRHIGIYAYRVRFLHQFVQWEQAPMETLECLEQLRAMHYGVGIHVDQACTAPGIGVDTPDDLEKLRQCFL
jgi:3-deoxy-manno-octulosonate cytidylyltransferase (CMP-KDO synthetase)